MHMLVGMHTGVVAITARLVSVAMVSTVEAEAASMVEAASTAAGTEADAGN